MKLKKEKKHIKNLIKERIMTKICKERGWNIDELTVGQMLFLTNHPDVRDIR